MSFFRSRRRAKAPAALLLAAAVALIAAGCEVPGDKTMQLPTQPGAQTTAVTYGPYTVPAATTDANGQMQEGMVSNQIQGNVGKPCTDCYVTGMRAVLHYADGSVADHNTDMMLHHMVLSDTTRPDATCPNGLFGIFKTGERFFASGNERTVLAAPAGYGYPVDSTSQWMLIYDLMNMKMASQTVAIDVIYDWVPKTTPGMKPIKPVWLDINQCGDSEMPAKTGQFDYQYTWTVNVPGNLVGLGGHLHDGGTVIEMYNDTKNLQVCNSHAAYGTTAGSIDTMGMSHLSSMTVCMSDGTYPIDNIDAGDQFRIVAKYDMDLHPPMGNHPVMGIVVAYVAPR